jgi:predicted nucleic acid-binding protein
MRLAMGEVGITDLIALELLQTARGATDFKLLALRLDALPRAPVGEAQWRRAYEIIRALAAKGNSVSPTSLIIAAAAEAKGWTLVYSDADFDLIAEVTAQDVKRL